jgi:hypothetical protein
MTNFNGGTIIGGRAERQIMILSLLKYLCILFIVIIIGCGNQNDYKSSVKVVEQLAQFIKAGEISKAKTLFTTGDFAQINADQLTALFGSDEIVSVDVELIEVVNPSNLRTDVYIYLNKNNERMRSKESLKLVFQDGNWKIHYNGSSWPKALKLSNYIKVPSAANNDLSEFAINVLNTILAGNKDKFMNEYAFTNYVCSVYTGKADEESFQKLRLYLANQFAGISQQYIGIDWIIKGQFDPIVHYDSKMPIQNLEGYYEVVVSMKYNGPPNEFRPVYSLKISTVILSDGKYCVFQF